MALLFCDGFDIYDDKPDAFAGGWSNVEGTTHTFSTTGGRYGGGCIGGTGTYPGWGVTLNAAPGAHFWVSFAHYHDGTGTTSEYMLYNRDTGAGVLFQLTYDATTGVVYVKDQNNSTVITSGAVLSAGWHWIEVEVTLGTDNSTGALALKIDGASEGSVTGIDTYTGNNLSTIGFYGAAAGWKVDDVIINDATGGVFDTPPGNCQIDTLRPDGSGGTDNWTPNTGTTYGAVDDPNGASDGDTTYIASSTVGQESRFTMTDLATASTSVYGVQVRTKSKRTDSGARTARGLVNRSGSESTGTTFTPDDTSYTWNRAGAFEVDPASGTAFTDANINALQAGVEVVS